jgi:bcr-type benzoyl-CoA reductase subunit C
MKKGLLRAAEIYGNRALRAQELRRQGKKVIGYFCIYPVLEIMTAFDIVPFRILGDMAEKITRADSCLPTIVCPFIRSAMDLSLKGRYDFFDGVVMSHSCEVGEKAAHIWRTYMDPKYFHFLDVPHTTGNPAVKQFAGQLRVFQSTLEQYTGKKISEDALREAIALCNEQRNLVQIIYGLRVLDPPLLSGSEMITILVAIMSVPVVEGNSLLHEVIEEVKSRNITQPESPHRLLIWGSILDNPSLVGMIEKLGANVVMDDTCVGSRAYFPLVNPQTSPIEALSTRYLNEIKCPRTFSKPDPAGFKKDHIQDLEDRFGYIKEYIDRWKVTGVILQSIRYCDIHGYDTPGLMDYLDHLGIPNIYIEHDYNEVAMAQLRTRIQAFLEIRGHIPETTIRQINIRG